MTGFRAYFWSVMKSAASTLFHKWSFALLAVALLVACGKEPLDGPAQVDAAGIAKGLPTVSDMSGTDEDCTGNPKEVTDGNGDTISDDGDDVGDGERNRKKKPN